jgi:hypothetical protein
MPTLGVIQHHTLRTRWLDSGEVQTLQTPGYLAGEQTWLARETETLPAIDATALQPEGGLIVVDFDHRWIGELSEHPRIPRLCGLKLNLDVQLQDRGVGSTLWRLEEAFKTGACTRATVARPKNGRTQQPQSIALNDLGVCSADDLAPLITRSFHAFTSIPQVVEENGQTVIHYPDMDQWSVIDFLFEPPGWTLTHFPLTPEGAGLFCQQLEGQGWPVDEARWEALYPGLGRFLAQQRQQDLTRHLPDTGKTPSRKSL